MKMFDGASINDMLEHADDRKISGIWVRTPGFLGISSRPWHVPGHRWAPELQSTMKFRPEGRIFSNLKGHDERLTLLAMPSDTKDMFVIERVLRREFNVGASTERGRHVATGWLLKEVDRYYEAGLNPILIWDSYHPQFMTTTETFPKQKWHTWLSLFDRIAFLTEGEAVIAQALNDIQAQERRSSGEDQGPSTPMSGTSGGMRMGGGGGTII